MSRITYLATAAAILLGASAAQADGVTDNKAVKARHGYYQMISFNLGSVVAMVKGEAEYDAAAAQAYADNLVTLSKLTVSPMWADGTDNKSLPGETRALPAIWEDVNAIRAEHVAFAKAAEGLAAVASNGVDALKPAVGQIGATCKSCHTKFRAKSF